MGMHKKENVKIEKICGYAWRIRIPGKPHENHSCGRDPDHKGRHICTCGAMI